MDALSIKVTPAATGEQLVRTSLPLPKGMITAGRTFEVSDGRAKTIATIRPLTRHPEDKSVRRAFFTFPYTFTSKESIHFTLTPVSRRVSASLPVSIEVSSETVSLAYKDGLALTARLLAPARTSDVKPRIKTVESNAHFLWQRIILPDLTWPRVIEIRADALGTVTLVAHLRRNLKGHGYMPELGWEVETSSSTVRLQGGKHSFADCTPCALSLHNDRYRIYHPAAPFKRKGQAELLRDGIYRYRLCTSDEKIPMQQASWRRVEMVIAPARLSQLTPTLEYPHEVECDWQLWDELYGTGKPLDLEGQSELTEILRYHHDAILRSMAVGDDWGNVTTFSDERETGDVYGMNRINLCPPIFEEGYRSGDRRLLQTAVLWCDNFHGQSIWWGTKETGGTRYNNLIPMGETPPDDSYMWRSNSSVHFCTKGFYAFLIAYEQTGDPRMMDALKAQVRYASRYVHASQDGCRNIGCVHDFVRLYRYTGDQFYLSQALRLFRELRTKLSTGKLFTESGNPIEPDPPFIETDAFGTQHPFAKPYILGYALLGLPELLEYAPDEPKLRDVVQAVTNFMVESQDPIGGWRYPHPRSSCIALCLAMEHAWQLIQADKVFSSQHLDAVEQTLRQRILIWLKTGRIISTTRGWEISTGAVKETSELDGLYGRPEDRDPSRDYTQGEPNLGSSTPEGLVYFADVLAFYLEHCQASRLLTPPSDDEPLGKLLVRLPGGSR